MGNPTEEIRAHCYFGGLVIAPAAGKKFKEAHAYDVISIFPSVIRDCPIPGGNMI